MQNWQISWALLTGVLLIENQALAEADVPVFTLTSAWQNKYVLEGRDALGDGGLATVEGSAELNGFTAALWYGVGTGESYQELNASLEYGLSLGAVDAYLGYTRLEFLKYDEKDHEITFGLAVNNIPWVTPALDYVYSTELDGAFVGLSLGSEFGFYGDRLILQPYILQGLDFGYASSEHDGKNNIQVGIELSLALSQRTQLIGSIAHSWAQKDVENDGLGDISWASIGLSSSF